MIRSDIVKMLLEIDEEVFLELGSIEPLPVVVLVGGAAFMLRDLTERSATHDLDVFMADEIVRRVMERYPNVNGAVAAYADQMPYNFEDRLVPLDLGTKAVDFVVPSNEDLVVMKLYAQRPNDSRDIESAARLGKIDWGCSNTWCMGRVRQMRPSCRRDAIGRWSMRSSASRGSSRDEPDVQGIPAPVRARADRS